MTESQVRNSRLKMHWEKGTITHNHLDKYLNKEMTIQEFGLMLSGRRNENQDCFLHKPI